MVLLGSLVHLVSQASLEQTVPPVSLAQGERKEIPEIEDLPATPGYLECLGHEEKLVHLEQTAEMESLDLQEQQVLTFTKSPKEREYRTSALPCIGK